MSKVDVAAIGRKANETIDGALESIYEWFASRLPTTVLGIAIRNLDGEVYSILDVGCGPRVPMYLLRKRRKVFTVGVDAFLRYLKSAQARRSHDAYILGDARYLPFREKSFDAVWYMEVIEHLEKEDGLSPWYMKYAGNRAIGFGQLEWENDLLVGEALKSDRPHSVNVGEYEQSVREFLYNDPQFILAIRSRLENSTRYDLIYVNPDLSLYVREEK